MKKSAFKLKLSLKRLLAAAVISLPVTIFCAPVSTFADTPASSERQRFSFADVHRRAARLASEPFQGKPPALPKPLRDLSYDQYRSIRFRPEMALWRDEKLPFEAQFFPLGFYFKQPVRINVVEDGRITPVAYNNDLFDFGSDEAPKDLPADLGFAGFRLHYPINQDNYLDEVAVFLGASYFRGVGRDQRYGISARGLAIDTGLDKPEEFPFFREFWIEKPDKDATRITVYALLDSESVTGAYRFVIQPGDATIFNVKASVFSRKRVKKFGIAPLTSMFLAGELTERPIDDFRPEVHDSDGLFMVSGAGEWIWRPLDNPEQLRIAAFQDENPRGFGLLQRDRAFENYQDLEAYYQDRPSTWVEPVGDWGKGVVQLLEIPSTAEIYDNIVAFWTPKRSPKAGDETSFEYRLWFFKKREDLARGGRVLATRIGIGGAGDPNPERRRVVIDFVGEKLAELNDQATVEAMVSASTGEIHNTVVQRNPFTNGWRLSFELDPQEARSVELRCYLKSGTDTLTETWSYRWTGS